MNTKHILLLAFSFVFLQNYLIFAQKPNENYSTTNKKAIKAYQTANDLFKERRFDEGLKQLKRAVEIDDKFAEAHYKMGATYMLFQDSESALPCYQKTIALAPDDDKFKGAYYNVALAMYGQGKYEEAKKHAEIFLAKKPTVAKFIEQTEKVKRDCDFAVLAIKNPVDFKPTQLPAPLNTFFLQYFPALTGDQKTIVFTVRKKPSSSKSNIANGADESIYVSQKNDQEQWSVPVSISDNINTPENEGTACISADGKTLVFTSCDQRGYRKMMGECDLFISYKQGDQWSEPENLGSAVNSRSWESQASLSADGKTLYFVSARPNGKGGRDIWTSKKDENGKWSQAENLAEVNTVQDDISPCIHPNGKTLFFASKGYAGMGGFDLYKTEIVDKKWTTPMNLGYPLNTHEDQVALFISADGKKGYYSLDKYKDGREVSSLLQVFDVPEIIQPKIKTNFLKGIVYDAKTKQKIDAQIDLFDLQENIKQASTTSDKQNGNYFIVLNQGSNYALEIHKKGYAFKNMTFDYSEKKQTDPLTIDIYLDPIAQGTVFRLNNIFFDFNKFDLKNESKIELNELVKFMKENPDVKGEISGHTDNVGNAQSNQTLSLNRAKSVYSYLLETGIDKERILYKGYGDTKPDVPNTTPENRAKNRRIEFKIL